MKKVLSILAATAALTVATGAMASIINTKHDLSSAGPSPYSTNTNQVCVFCHTPHNSTVTRALWNRNNPTGSFSLYTSGANVESLSWYVGGANKTTLPTDSPSLLCLSCHDGSTSLVSISAKPGDIGTDPLEIQDATVRGNGSVIGSSGGAALTSDLTNDHPISLVYENVRASVGMAATLHASDSNGLVNGLPLSKRQNLECNTCHNVHDNTIVPFLRMSNDQSALCRACHIK